MTMQETMFKNEYLPPARAILTVPQWIIWCKANGMKPPQVPKKGKYYNTVVYCDGMRFDSRKEAEYYVSLCEMLEAGRIKKFERQVDFPLIVNGQKVCSYRADFVVTTNNEKEKVIDVKSEYTAKDPVFILKSKLFTAVHGYSIIKVI